MANPSQNSFFSPVTGVFIELYRRVLRLVNLRPAEHAESIKILTDLCLAQSTRRARHYTEKALPEALLQAFTVEPLMSGDARFVGREEQLTRISSALERWHTGHSSMIAVTGPQGCGLSSFLRQLEQLVGSNGTFRYSKLTRRPYDIRDTLAMLSEFAGFEQPAKSVEELLARINELPASVFVIDNGYFLSCRVMGAHDAIRVFGAVMVATQQRHLWILGCEEYAWRRLTYIYHADRYFTDRIELAMFSGPELDQCLALRQQMSGVQLNSKMDSGDKELPDELESELPTLYKLSNGKPDFAFFYYLGGLQVNPENKQLDMKPVSALDFSALKKLIREELFTLAEVAVHGSMTIDDHRALFRSSREESWLLLERLYQQCLLDNDETEEEPRYRLVPVYSEVISRYLTSTNYLY
jgi:hypothetical protein